MAAVLALATIVVVSGVHGAGAQGDPRQVCQNDAMQLCGEFVPDEKKITACMMRKHRQVSAECRLAMAHGGRHAGHEGRRHRHCRHCG
jgi:hypothetical protein